MQVIGPDRRMLRNTERESSGKFAFTAHVDGVYTYCFKCVYIAKFLTRSLPLQQQNVVDDAEDGAVHDICELGAQQRASA